MRSREPPRELVTGTRLLDKSVASPERCGHAEGAGAQAGRAEPEGAPRLPHRGHLRGRAGARRHRGEVAAAGPRVPGRRLRRHRRTARPGCTACTSRSTPRAPGPTTTARRKRKLLLNRVEIDKIERKVSEKGYTIVPLALYFKDGRAKVEIALAKGKKSWDKRQTLRERQADREKQQALGRRLKGHDE